MFGDLTDELVVGSDRGEQGDFNRLQAVPDGGLEFSVVEVEPD
jgi:hypothetical protein